MSIFDSHAVAVALSIIGLAPFSAHAQERGPNPSYTVSVVGTVPPIVRYDYTALSATAGTLTVQICNTPVCEVVVRPSEPPTQSVTVRFDNGPPISINNAGPTVIYSGPSMLNASHSISVSGGKISIEVSGRS